MQRLPVRFRERAVLLAFFRDDIRDEKAVDSRGARIPSQPLQPVLKQQVESLKPDLVIDIVLQSCHTYNVEAVKVESYVREDLGTNYLKVVTDFSQQDLGQLKTRIAAALEMN